MLTTPYNIRYLALRQLRAASAYLPGVRADPRVTPAGVADEALLGAHVDGLLDFPADHPAADQWQLAYFVAVGAIHAEGVHRPLEEAIAKLEVELGRSEGSIPAP